MWTVTLPAASIITLAWSVSRITLAPDPLTTVAIPTPMKGAPAGVSSRDFSRQLR